MQIKQTLNRILPLTTLLNNLCCFDSRAPLDGFLPFVDVCALEEPIPNEHEKDGMFTFNFV